MDRAANQRSAFSLSFTLALYISNGCWLENKLENTFSRFRVARSFREISKTIFKTCCLAFHPYYLENEHLQKMVVSNDSFWVKICQFQSKNVNVSLNSHFLSKWAIKMVHFRVSKLKKSKTQQEYSKIYYHFFWNSFFLDFWDLIPKFEINQ